jgi:thiamine pyrophosphate-dependent acetolactate synthase large subunit-like protein
MKNYQDGGEAILEAFRSLGAEYVISSPGSEWAPVWEAFARQTLAKTEGPRYLDVGHETAAVGMALGYALATGRMQIVLLHAGAGLLQGTCGIHGALLAEVPMLVLSAESDSYGERQGVDPGSQWYRNLSIVGGPHVLVQHIVKWSNRVPGVETLYEMVKRAGEMAQRAPRGPVYLNVSVEALLADWTPPKFKMPTAAVPRKMSPPDDIAVFAKLLAEAEAPLIMTESGGRDPAAFRALVELADALAIPVVEPQSAICGNFPRSHPMHQGGDAQPLVANADLVVLVNCRAPWYPPSNRPPKAKTVVIDEVPQRPHIVHQVLFADLYLEGDVASTLSSAATEARCLRDDAKVQARRELHTAAHASLEAKQRDAEEKAAANTREIEPQLLLKALRRALPSDAIFVDETITHSRLAQHYFSGNQPHRYFYVQGGLGQGIGVALGVKLARTADFVVLGIGDGSFIYNPVIAALAASRDCGLPILIVVFNNKKYLSMKLNHLRSYPDGAAATHDLFHGVNLDTQPPLERFGEPFGMQCQSVSAPAELEVAVEKSIDAVRNGRTAILNVMLAR